MNKCHKYRNKFTCLLYVPTTMIWFFGKRCLNLWILQKPLIVTKLDKVKWYSTLFEKTDFYNGVGRTIESHYSMKTEHQENKWALKAFLRQGITTANLVSDDYVSTLCQIKKNWIKIRLGWSGPEIVKLSTKISVSTTILGWVERLSVTLWF